MDKYKAENKPSIEVLLGNLPPRDYTEQKEDIQIII